MSFWSRVANALWPDRLHREWEEELQSHIEEAIAEGRDPEEARRAFGPALRQKEASHAVRTAAWLDGVRADVIFGWRQLRRNRVTSAAAVLSLALAMGACVSAFRLIDALVWRPLPVVHPERLFAISRDEISMEGQPNNFDGWAYPDFALMRDAVRGQADLIAVSYTDRTDLTYRGDEEMEKGYVQYVSGEMWPSLGLRPSLGTLFTAKDDDVPGTHPVAVLSYDYWARRFGRDPKVIGRTFRVDSQLFEIVGVGPESFTGTEPGTVTDIFLPTAMHRWVSRDSATWHRTLAMIAPGTALEPLRARLDAVNLRFETERSKGFKGMPQQNIDNYLRQRMVLSAAPSGVSDLQGAYKEALEWLGGLVLLVLMIACVNVANLMTALASARTREMALRVSIGAGRWRLVQMVLVESAMLALLAGTLGALFAWRAAPLVLRFISSADNPARLILPFDGRVLAFGVALIVAVMLLFGLLPALRASSVKPVRALKGGEDPHARRRTMHGMIAAQVAFCFMVVFAAGLFVETFHRLTQLPLGFSPQGLLLLESVAPQGRSPQAWSQVADMLRSRPGVEGAAESGWPLMASSWNDSVAINGGPASVEMVYFLGVSPGWFATMGMPILAGREFLPNEVFPGAAIVNQTFVRHYFPGVDPVGRYFEKAGDDGGRVKCLIVGVAADAPYRSVREPQLPVAFLPLREVDAKGVAQPEHDTTFVLRMADKNPMARAVEFRKLVSAAHLGIRVSNVRTQQELIDGQTVRERLLAILGIFFAVVALLLAAIGLYGVLSYSVLQRRREIGIRVALGARVAEVFRLVTERVFAMVMIGVVAGVGLGLAVGRYMESLFFHVKPSDVGMLAIPSSVILAAALVATLPAVWLALRIDPAEVLRSE